ncbi:MAG: dihydropteroate synthase [Lentisphaeria bacterium]|jgi:dihydropteroate synthase
MNREQATFVQPPECRFAANGRELALGRRVLLMGIVNVTPDSFSDGGRCATAPAAVAQALRLAAEGAEILDLGGESTRPGAAPVAAAAELARVLPVLRELRPRTDCLLSVDTWKAEVARAAVAEGADIINDISGLQRDPAMLEVLRSSRVGCVLMHLRGTPQTMQTLTDYADLLGEIRAFFAAALARAEQAGVGRDRFLLDPGLGFSKTAEQNHELIRGLPAFLGLGRPLLLGPSRKSFIGKLLGGDCPPPPAARDWGTAAAVAAGVLAGATVLRVHEVAAMRDVVRVAAALRPASGGGGPGENGGA